MDLYPEGPSPNLLPAPIPRKTTNSSNRKLMVVRLGHEKTRSIQRGIERNTPCGARTLDKLPQPPAAVNQGSALNISHYISLVETSGY
jgi:hypothetical protein